MTEFAAPAAKRLQRPSWRDSRLVVGVLLVLLAATLGAKAIASADDRVPLYVAADDLVAGDRVTASSFTRVDALLGEGINEYLSADAAPPEGQFLLRDIRRGELVPDASLGSAEQVSVQRVTVRADSVSTNGLTRGSRVDVYVTPKGALGADQAPATTSKVLRAAAVAAVLTSEGGFGSSSTTSVQIYVPADRVQTIIESVDAEAKITLVPATTATTGGGS